MKPAISGWFRHQADAPFAGRNLLSFEQPRRGWRGKQADRMKRLASITYSCVNGVCHLHDIWCCHEYRRRGLATRLLAELPKYAPFALTITAHATTPKAHAWNLANGFTTEDGLNYTRSVDGLLPVAPPVNQGAGLSPVLFNRHTTAGLSALIADAARATELFSEDELEQFAAQQSAVRTTPVEPQ